MKNGNKILITIIITLLILLLITGGAFAYVYLATDILKTDKELFFKYFSQIAAEETEYTFIDNRISDFYKKKTQTPYENSGEITVDVEYPEELMVDEDVIARVNKIAVRFSGNVDSVNQKVQQNIELDYGNDVILPINYRQDGNKFGLQTDELSKKFIAIKNENLQELTGGITGEISFDSADFEKLKFTEEEISQLELIYKPILTEILTDEKFSRVKSEQSESYILELTNEQIKNTIVKLLEATKQNTLIIDKINEIILMQDSEAEKIDATIIDDILESINEIDLSNIPNLKITLMQSDKKLNQIIIQSGEVKISVEKYIIEDSLSYDINCEVKVEETESSSILEETTETTEKLDVNAHFEIEYNGLSNSADVEANYELGFSLTAEGQTIAYNYKIDTNTKFAESVTIETLDETSAVFLNDYDETQVTNFLTQVGTKLLQINKEQMAELGLEEHENPLLYANPITIMLGITIFNEASESIENTSNLADYQLQQFNQKFTKYEGIGLSGADVNALILTVQNTNLSSAEQPISLVKVTLDGNEIYEKVDLNKTYNVEAIYGENRVVTEMRVTTNN